LLSQKENELIKKIYDVRKIKNVVKNDFNGVIVSLLDKTYEVVCLGIIEEVDFVNEKIYIFVPKGNKNKVIKIIQFGSLKLTLDIKEAGFVEPGLL
jgi:polynucleotide 5'-kinase involved in rRNA processing